MIQTLRIDKNVMNLISFGFDCLSDLDTNVKDGYECHDRFDTNVEKDGYKCYEFDIGWV